MEFKSLFEKPAIAILLMAFVGLCACAYFLLKSFQMWQMIMPAFCLGCLVLVIAIMVIQTTSGNFEQGTVSNGMLVSAYLAACTYQTLTQLESSQVTPEPQDALAQSYLELAMTAQKQISNAIFNMVSGDFDIQSQLTSALYDENFARQSYLCAGRFIAVFASLKFVTSEWPDIGITR